MGMWKKKVQVGDFFKIYLLRYQAVVYLPSKRLLDNSNGMISTIFWTACMINPLTFGLYLVPPCAAADWRMFADQLGYSYADIKRISNRTQLLERPTVLLLNLLTSKYPDFSLEELRDVCMKASDSYSTLIQRIDHICSNQGWTSNGV